MYKARTFAAAAVLALSTGQAMAANDVMVVLDGSNSMWGQIEGTAKIEIAREAMEHLFGEWTDGTNVGLMAYGHRRQGDCNDIETMITPQPFERRDFMARVSAISPKGKTPLTAAVEQAAEALAYRDNPATVVLITDGIESCQRDPCALAEELARMGVGFTAHVVGFDLQGEEQEAVACMAERTGGRFVAAGNADELGAALDEVGAAVAEAPAPEPEVEPEPEPETPPSVTLSAPHSATSGATFLVSWEAAEQAPQDYVTIVAMGADEGASGNYMRVGDKTEGTLQAPAEPGLYEVRYVLHEGRKTLATAEIEIVAAQASVEAPDTASTGEQFPVSWSEGIHPQDYVTIVPAGTPEGGSGHYTRVGDKTEGTLRAPAEPGLYEVRYVLHEGRKTLATAEIEIVAAQASVEAPDTASTGEQFPVSWSEGIHPQDYVTIVPAGTPEGDSGHYTRVGDKTEGTLRAPAEPGLYEVRYVLHEGRKTLATAEIEIVAAQASVEAPDTASTGEQFPVSWSEGIHPQDYVTIVPAGTPEGDSGHYTRVGDKTEGTLRAPAEPGLYEVRYVLHEGRKTLATAEIEIVAAQASVQAPESALVGASFPVQWSSGIHPRDYVTIVAMGAAEGTHGDYTRVGDSGNGTLRAPAEPGLYEVRYVLQEGSKTLASAEIEIAEADVELDGPATVRAGSDIVVAWSGTPPHPRDYVTIVPMGAEEGAHGDYVRVSDRDEASLKAPEETGLYEIRYVLDQGKRILARHMVEIVGQTAALNDGGLLEAPEAGAPGETVEVRWTAENTANDQRVTLATSAQADFTWIEVQQATDGPLSFTLPEQPGFYEFRLLDVTARKVLSRVTINVQ